MSAKRQFDHVLVIMFENMYRSYIMQNDYFRSLAEQGIDMTNYFGVMHPSQTNYISSIAGELCKVIDDEQPNPLTQRTVVDLIEDQGLSWKAYMDGYNPVEWTQGIVPADEFPYVIKHNPFSSFENIINNADRWSKIDNQFGFYNDVATGKLPNYAWFTPDMWNDGHYLVGTQSEPAERAPLLVDQQANWLNYFFANLNFPGPDSLLPDNTLVVITFDEADYEADWDKGKKYTYDGPNQVYTVLLGDKLSPAKQDEGFNHYSLLRTVEKNFSLNDLAKNDSGSNWFQFLQDKQFAWAEPVATPLPVASCIAVASFNGELIAACVSDSGIEIWHLDGSAWTCSQSLSLQNVSDVGLCVTAGRASLQLFYSTDKGVFCSDVSNLTAASQLVSEATANISVHSAWNNSVVMLVWSDVEGNLKSIRTPSDGQSDISQWSQTVALKQKTDGDICLASIGPSIYLVFKKIASAQMQVLSYNLAQFNTVTYVPSKYSGPYDNTVANQWNPSAFPVAHFSHMASPVTPGEGEPLTQAYVGKPPYVAATLDGVIHLLHGDASDPRQNQLLSETFSISGIMTPQLPVSYNASDAKTTSNGYGGLAEAGWSEQTALELSAVPGSPMAITQHGGGVTLIYRDEQSQQTFMANAKYSCENRVEK